MSTKTSPAENTWLSDASLSLGELRVATPKTVSQESYEYPGVFLVPRASGGSWLAWTDSDWNARVTPLDAQDQRSGEDIVLPRRAVMAMIPHEEGFALLLSEPHDRPDNKTLQLITLSLARFDEQGRKGFEKVLIEAADILDTEATILDGWGDKQLIWTGEHYAVYCPTSHNFGTKARPDIHQGDALFLLTGSGDEITTRIQTQVVEGKDMHFATGGWNWNVSHSFEQRLAGDSQLLAMLAKGDAYPRGLTLNFQAVPDAKLPAAKTVYKQGSQNLLPIKGELGENYVPLSLGDIIMLDDGVLASFTTSEDRDSYDVGLLKVDWQGRIQFQKWLTGPHDGHDEHSVRMIRQGKHILIGWSSFSRPPNEKPALDTDHACCERTFLGRIDEAGEWLAPPIEQPLSFPFSSVIHERRQIHVSDDTRFDIMRGSRFEAFPDGSVRWADALGEPGMIRIHRVRP